MNLMMLISSSVGTFQYVFVMSKDASLVYWFTGMSFKSSINCNEFRTLNKFGSGMCSCKSLDRSLVNLYAGAFCQLMIGRMGELALCILWYFMIYVTLFRQPCGMSLYIGDRVVYIPAYHTVTCIQ